MIRSFSVQKIDKSPTNRDDLFAGFERELEFDDEDSMSDNQTTKQFWESIMRSSTMKSRLNCNHNTDVDGYRRDPKLN